MNQNHLTFICAELTLGSPMAAPTSIYGSRGGSFMWKLTTDRNTYAIKQLSPDINLNAKMVTKYNLSEDIAWCFKQQGIPAVYAIKHSRKYLIRLENTGYLVYPWVEGVTLGRNEISAPHAIKIAQMLAALHRINMVVPEAALPRFDIYSNDDIVKAIDEAAALKCAFAKTLKEKQELILSANDRYLAAIPILQEQSVITHGDLNQLNVLWDKADKPTVIDWESARRLNPTREIVRASLDWSGLATDKFSLQLFNQMLSTYHKSGGSLNLPHIKAALHGSFGNMIFWLLYNINIAKTFNIPEKKAIAIKEINQTLETMLRLKRFIPEILGSNMEQHND